LRAQAEIYLGKAGSGVVIEALDLQRRYPVAAAPADDPLALIVRLTLSRLGIHPLPDWRLRIRSAIPIAGGLGSGAAVATACVRALVAAANADLAPDEISRLVYESEKVYHGTPSGIDNTVVAYEQPVYFARGKPPQPFTAARPFHIIVADTGVASPTKITVGDVRRAWEADRARYEAIFDRIGQVAEAARQAIETGDPAALGPLMDENQALLRQLDISSPELERLITAALQAGATGAKLSGGGRGGNMVALVTGGTQDVVMTALQRAGAVRVIAQKMG
jgi:mevalonate kinase